MLDSVRGRCCCGSDNHSNMNMNRPLIAMNCRMAAWSLCGDYLMVDCVGLVVLVVWLIPVACKCSGDDCLGW